MNCFIIESVRLERVDDGERLDSNQQARAGHVFQEKIGMREGDTIFLNISMEISTTVHGTSGTLLVNGVTKLEGLTMDPDNSKVFIYTGFFGYTAYFQLR